MSKSTLLLLCGFLALPAHAAPALTQPCGKTDLVRVSPTNPNDPLFPPGQWPKCTVSSSIRH